MSTPTTLPHLMQADVFTRLKPEDLSAALVPGQGLLLIDMKGERRYVEDNATYTAEQWATATAKGLVFILTMRRWFYSEFLTDAGLPVVPLPYEAVTEQHKQAPVQTEIPLKP